MIQAGTSIAIRPAFLEGSAGRVFTMYFEPMLPPLGAVLCIAPFGEEMNRCRSLMSAQARRFADLGYGCLLLDLYGTGDSGGDLPDASWDIWQGDVATAAAWLEEETGHTVTLWGIRLGGLLAAETANSQPDRFDRLILWQPVYDGKSFVTQTLRLRVAGLVDRNHPAEKTSEMRAQLATGACVEVSGYLLPGRLTTELDRKQMTGFERLTGKQLDWLECVAEADRPLTGGSNKTIERLTALGVQVTAHGVVAPPIWNLHKKAGAPALIDATSALFTS